MSGTVDPTTGQGGDGLRAAADEIENEVRRLHAPAAMNDAARAGWDIGMARAAYLVRRAADRRAAHPEPTPASPPRLTRGA